MIDKIVYLQNTLGLTHDQVANILKVSAAELKRHVNGTKRLEADDFETLNWCYRYLKFAVMHNREREIPESDALQQSCIAELLSQNEQQQNQLADQIRMQQLTEKQKITRASLLKIFNEPHCPSGSWPQRFAEILDKMPKPAFEKELYQNQIKLKALKHERTLLERDLRHLIEDLPY